MGGSGGPLCLSYFLASQTVQGKKDLSRSRATGKEVGGHILPNHLSLACAGSAIPWLRDAAAPRRTLRTTVWGVTRLATRRLMSSLCVMHLCGGM